MTAFQSKTCLIPNFINQSCSFSLHSIFTETSIATLIKTIFDSDKYDLENITPLIHVPSVVCWFSLLRTVVVTLKLYLEQYHGKDSVKNQGKFSELLFMKVYLISHIKNLILPIPTP